MKRSVASYPVMVAATVLAAISVQAQTKPAPASPTPSVKISASARVLFDNDVYLQDDAPLAAGQTVAATPANAESWVGVASLTLAYANKSNPALTTDFSYSPEVWHFDSYHQENHVDNRFAGTLAGKVDNWRYEAKANWLFVNGSKTSPIYNRLGGGPAIGGAPVRNRRSQNLLQGSGFLTYAFEPWFLRLAAAGSRQDFNTYERSTSGYSNYVDRSDLNVGPDLGRKIGKAMNAFVGFRMGSQKQYNLLGVNNNFSNTYTRVHAGFEGNLLPDLKASITAGPDFREYGSARKVGTAEDRIDTYIDATLTWTPSKADSLILSSKRNMLVGGGGRSAYANMKTQASWNHSFSPKWSISTVYSQEEGDLKDMTASLRHDWIYQASVSVTHVLPTKTKLEVGLMRDWAETSVDNTPGRAYKRWMGFAGLNHSF